MKHRCSWCGNEHVLDPVCDAAWKENGEKQAKCIASLEATCEKQSEHISEQGKRIAEREKEMDRQTHRLTHSEFHRVQIRAHLKRQRSTIKEQVVGMGRAKQRTEEAEAKLAEIVPILKQAQEQISEEDDVAIAMEAERDKLREACEAFVIAWEKSDQLEKTDVALQLAKAALAKGNKKC